MSEGKKTSKPIHILTALFTTKEFTKKTNKFYRTNQPRENFGQHNLLYVYLSACWKTGQNPCKNKHGKNCIAQVVCWYFVRLCGAADVGCEVSEFTKKTNKFYRTNRPRDNFGQHNLLYVSLSACWKTGQNPCKNKHGKNCIAQVVCWYFVRLCGAADVGCEVSEFTKKTNKFYRTNRPRDNFGQHNLLYVSLSACWKTGQNPCKNKHCENCVAQVVCWYFVRLCGAAGVGCKVSEGKQPSKPIHILTALFTTRVHKENKQVLPYQPTSGKFWPT